ETARDLGWRCWRGHCVPIGDAALPYAPIVEILGDAAGEQVGFGTQAQQLAGLAAALDRLAQEPTVLVVEDLQWADQGTRGLLDLMVRTDRRVPRLIVCTFRDDELVELHPVRAML